MAPLEWEMLAYNLIFWVAALKTVNLATLLNKEKINKECIIDFIILIPIVIFLLYKYCFMKGELIC